MIRLALPLVVALALVPCGSAAAAVDARGSAEQVLVTGLKPGARVKLGATSQRAGSLGGVVFRNVRPGRYTVAGRRVRVFSTRSAPPSAAVYKQKLPASGYGYLKTRDGSTLAIDVHLPLMGARPPYPTVVEYSGYGYANPAGGESSIAQIANLLGFAVVDVNMRGTGCSGGAFDYFEPLQGLDGYDVIETVARQPWVLGGRVGMMGISYGGISQLFVAATRPPHLAAIAPLSVIDDTATTLYPGGMLNTGFALSWGKDRAHDAKPASANGGQAWALARIRAGDRVCRANQVLHAEAIDLIAKARANSTYVPKVADPLAPVTFVRRIGVPVFLACQFTDEQTGGHCPALASRFTGTTRKWFTFTNGTHIDSLDPATFNRWFDFLSLYVARRAPALSDSVKSLAPAVFQTSVGVSGVTLPDDPIQSQPSYEAALAAFEALPPVRIMFDNGAGATPGFPVAGFEQSFASWPAPGTQARGWDLGPEGTFTLDPKARPATSFTGNTAGGPGGLWTATPTYRWLANPAGTAHELADRAAGGRHGRDRGGRARGVDQGLGGQRRPAGDDLRAAPGRARDVRAERLAEHGAAQARCAQEHLAGADSQPPGPRPLDAAARPLHADRRPALLPGARLPGRLAHPRDRLGGRRRPARLVVRRRPEAQGHGQRARCTPAAPGGAGRRGAVAASSMSGIAWRGMPLSGTIRPDLSRGG